MSEIFFPPLKTRLKFALKMQTNNANQLKAG